jgi:MoxR-like ATPase
MKHAIKSSYLKRIWYNFITMSIFRSPEATYEALVRVGYLTTRDIATDIYLAAVLNLPILLEGPAGGGKTELARSVAAAEGMELIPLQCYEGIGDKQAIGDFNRSLQEMYVLLQTKKEGGADWNTIRREITSRDFFMSGPLLQAIESEKRCLLLIDEIDKVNYAFEALLLEILSIWQMSVPGLGVIRAKHPPFTVITSNAERPLGFPLRRRSIFLEIGHPTPETEAAIVARKTPNCPPELHRFIAGFAKALRAWTMLKPPSISEMNNLAMALHLLGRTEILPEDKGILLPLVAKLIEDRDRLLMREMFEDLVRRAKINADQMADGEVNEELESMALAETAA